MENCFKVAGPITPSQLVAPEEGQRIYLYLNKSIFVLCIIAGDGGCAAGMSYRSNGFLRSGACLLKFEVLMGRIQKTEIICICFYKTPFSLGLPNYFYYYSSLNYFTWAAGISKLCTLEDFQFMIFHTPFCKLVQKSFARILLNDFLASHKPDSGIYKGLKDFRSVKAIRIPSPILYIKKRNAQAF